MANQKAFGNEQLMTLTKVFCQTCHFDSVYILAALFTDTASDKCRQTTQTFKTAMKKPRTILFLATCLILSGAGCSTMHVAPITSGSADSYVEHEQIDGLVVGVRPMTDKAEVKETFKIDLLDKGLLPILVVAENKSPTVSFIIPREKVGVLDNATGITSASQRKKVTSSSGEVMANTGAVLVGLGGYALPLAVIGMPLEFTGMQKQSNASIIEFNLADNEFYTHTLGPGDKAQGFIYYQLPKDAAALSNCHVVAEAKNPATGETTAFDFPLNINLPK